jgi:hypothetical protein
VVVKGLDHAVTNGEIQALLAEGAATLRVNAPMNGFVLHRIPSGLMFIRGHSDEEQEANLQIAEHLKTRFNVTIERPHNKSQPRQHHQQQQHQQQQQYSQQPLLPSPQQHHHQYPPQGYPQYPPQAYQQPQPQVFYPQFQPYQNLNPPPAGFQPNVPVNRYVPGQRHESNYNHPPAHQQGYKRSEAPAHHVAPGVEKRMKPDSEPSQLLNQVSQLKKLQALKAKLDAMQAAKK